MFDKLKRLLQGGVAAAVPGGKSWGDYNPPAPQAQSPSFDRAGPLQNKQSFPPYSGTPLENDLDYRTKFIPPSPFATGSTVNPEVRANSFMGRAEDDQYVITPTGSKPLYSVNPGEQWEGLPGPAQFKPPAPYKEDPLEQFKRFLNF